MLSSFISHYRATGGTTVFLSCDDFVTIHDMTISTDLKDYLMEILIRNESVRTQ